MLREEAIKEVEVAFDIWESEYDTGNDWSKEHEARDMAIKALEQETCEDEIILTKEEYGQLLSNEFDNGYAKGYREALEQDSILDKIRAEIEKLQKTCDKNDLNLMAQYSAFGMVLDIFDKYKAGEE